MSAKNILLTGQPGSGKTSLIKKVLEQATFSVGGFLSNEMRRGNQRVGFTLDTLNGQRGILAHIDLDTDHRVGKYHVDVNSLESVGVQAIEDALDEHDVVIIDEIGKMELLSDRFQQVLESALKSHKPLLGTVMQGKNRLTDELKDRPDVSVFHVNEETRSYLVNEIILRLNSIIGNGHGANGNNGSGSGTN